MDDLTPPLKVRAKPYSLPSYSLTGDLMGFMRCGLQYRFRKIGRMEPSVPVQLWFGEFIHGVMDEAHRVFEEGSRRGVRELPPWPDAKINSVMELIENRLAARGLRAGSADDRLLGMLRAKAAVQMLGPHLFPLISRSEVRLYGSRRLPPSMTAGGAPDRYEVTGVVDVLSSVEMGKPEHAGNVIVQLIKERIAGPLPDTFEVIVDYKGTKKPGGANGATQKQFQQNEWQLQTYAGLRQRQADSNPVYAGVLLYLNELVPNLDDIRAANRDSEASVESNSSWALDAVVGAEEELKKMKAATFQKRLEKTVHVVAISESTIDFAARQFDHVVADIEKSRLAEQASGSVLANWPVDASDEKTCGVCDQKSFCPALSGAKPRSKKSAVPSLPSVGAKKYDGPAEPIEKPAPPIELVEEEDAREEGGEASTEEFSYELGLIERILYWAEDNPYFNTNFVLSLRDWLEDGIALTPAQFQALENIIEGWDID